MSQNIHPKQLDDKTRRRNLVVLICVMMVNALSYGVIIPLLYPYAARFGMHATGFGFLIASYSLFQFLATPIIGRLSDRYGRKPLLLFSLVGTAGSLALFALANSLPLLFIARIVDGVTGGNISVAQAVIADSTKPADRAKYFGFLGASFGFGFLVGPALGGLLGAYGTTLPFWAAAGLALAAASLAAFWLTETRTPRAATLSVHEHLFDPRKLVHALFIPVTGLILLVGFVASLAQNAMIIGFQSYTVDVFKMSVQAIGLLFTLIGVLNVITQGVGIKWYLKAFSHKRTAGLVALVATAAFSMAMPLFGVPWQFTAILMGYVISFSPVNAILSSLLSERTHAEDQGGILGISQSYMSLGQIGGPLLAGLLMHVSSVGTIFWAVAVLLAVCAVMMRRIPAASPSTQADI